MDAIHSAMQPTAVRNPKLWAAATALEASFLSEMLKSVGLGESRQTFGGGVGEDQFSGFLNNAYAGSIVDAGGIGLAESIYNSLARVRP